MKHSDVDESIVACIPVDEAKLIMPSFPACATYSTYEQVPCPRCQRPMWLGARSKIEVDAGRATMACIRCLVLAGQIVHDGEVRSLHREGQ